MSSTTRTQTVGTVTEQVKVSASTLRVWERQKLIPPPARSSDGRRQYTDEQVTIIRNFAQQRRKGRQPTSSGEQRNDRDLANSPAVGYEVTAGLT